MGDSDGGIYCCRIQINYSETHIDQEARISHKELQGDQINCMIPHPEFPDQIFVQSRDNCVRLLQYDSTKGPRIKKRFFGAHCKELMVRFTISPDAQFLVSGSEDGKPRIWSTLLEERISQVPYECKMLDLVSDCQWNPRYNMFAVSGFG